MPQTGGWLLVVCAAMLVLALLPAAMAGPEAYREIAQIARCLPSPAETPEEEQLWTALTTYSPEDVSLFATSSRLLSSCFDFGARLSWSLGFVRADSHPLLM
jgi:hypothetical protein